MNEPFLCTVDPSYMFYLSRVDSRVSKKCDLDRPFIANVVAFNGFQYAIPLTSQIIPASGKPRSKRFTSFVTDSHGITISALLYNNMIPVTDRNISKFNIDNAPVNNRHTDEIRFIRSNNDEIMRKARNVYELKDKGGDSLCDLICCDFKSLEEKCLSFNQTKTEKKEETEEISTPKYPK